MHRNVLVVFTIGIPNGSLIDSSRGGLKELLENARINVKNLGENKPLEITNIPWLKPVIGRPQELPALASGGYVDVFFCGDDWVEEWRYRGKSSKKMLGLGIGKVDIVIAGKSEELKYPCRIASEYPFIAKNAIETFSGFSPDIIDFGDEIPSKKYVIIKSCGTTEAKNYYDQCDFVVEATQSGESLKNYRLKLQKTLMESECSFYCSDRILSDSWKMKKASRIEMMLAGVIAARAKDLITFNISNEKLDDVVRYIQRNRLFGDEETVIKGKRMTEITLEVSSRNCNLLLIDIIGDLKDLGASCIEGIPLSYSIR